LLCWLLRIDPVALAVADRIAVGAADAALEEAWGRREVVA
jgi:hypothetical protein